MLITGYAGHEHLGQKNMAKTKTLKVRVKDKHAKLLSKMARSVNFVWNYNGNGVTGREYRALEQKLSIAQRANNKNRVKAIHAKIKNRRQDALHKYSRKLVNENAAIFVGNVSSQAMVKTKKAKSALDAGWGLLKTMLEYKCDYAGVVFEVVNEAYSTQTCSSCGLIPDSSLKGRTGLGIRGWVCSECGAEHQRDINAARNILALGHERLAGGIPHYNRQAV